MTDRDVTRLGVVAFSAATATFLAIATLAGGTRVSVALAAIVGLGVLPLVLAPQVGLTPGDLGLVRPRAQALLGALLLGATFWYVNVTLTAPLATALSGPEELDDLRGHFVEGSPLLILLLTTAVVPAVTEELACRGFLFGALRRSLPTWLAVVASATVFAALHLSLMRAAPTWLLGVLLATVRARTGDVTSAMLLHFVNNAVALAALHAPDAAWARWVGAHPGPALTIALGGSALGAVLVATCPRAAAR